MTNITAKYFQIKKRIYCASCDLLYPDKNLENTYTRLNTSIKIHNKKTSVKLKNMLFNKSVLTRYKKKNNNRRLKLSECTIIRDTAIVYIY